MELNYIEAYIKVAEKDYITTQDKVDFVNIRLKRSKIILEGGKQKVVRNNLNPKKPIGADYYYKKVGELKHKSRARGHLISKMFLPDLIDEHDTLIMDRKEFREIIQKSQSLDRMQTVVIAKREQIDLGRRIFAVKELIKVYMEEPDLEDEDQVERQIQLLTTV